MSDSQMIDTTVELCVPRRAEFVRTARLTASGIAALVAFDIDRIDDLRITVNEMCSTLMELGRDEVRLSFTIIEGGITVIGTTTPAAQGELNEERFGFTEQIVDVLADEHEFRISDDEVRYVATLLAQSSEPSADGGHVDGGGGVGEG